MHVQFSKLIQSMCIKRVKTKQDGNLMVMILKYLETPQFLRKRLFPKMNDLKFAGVLQPLRIASHVTLQIQKKSNKGDIREGIVISVKVNDLLMLE